jgi:glycerate-2-kinase
VPGNDIAIISSGPTVLDTSTVADARAVLEKYGVVAAANIEFLETPKEPHYFERVQNLLFLSSADALTAMKSAAEKFGYAATIADDRFDGEARETGRTIVANLHTTPAKTALLYAGESTVTLPEHHGAGGRNEEMALAMLDDIRDDEFILPFASDGHDNTSYAGAIADAVTREHALTQNLSSTEYLDGHRSYDFFTSTGDALITGYTGSNVSDLIIALKK